MAGLNSKARKQSASASRAHGALGVSKESGERSREVQSKRSVRKRTRVDAAPSESAMSASEKARAERDAAYEAVELRASSAGPTLSKRAKVARRAAAKRAAAALIQAPSFDPDALQKPNVDALASGIGQLDGVGAAVQAGYGYGYGQGYGAASAAAAADDDDVDGDDRLRASNAFAALPNSGGGDSDSESEAEPKPAPFHFAAPAFVPLGGVHDPDL